MLPSSSLLWATFTTLVTLARPSTEIYNNESITCETDCSLNEQTSIPVLIFAWANSTDLTDSEGQAEGPGDTSVTSSAVIVTVVNTVLNTTSLLTEYPPDYVPPPTNAAGTRVTTITYDRFSTNYTTVLAYPTPFVWWPDEYGWAGTLQVSSKCETVTSGYSTIPLTSAPQPTNTAEILAVYKSFDKVISDVAVFSEDPKGLSYSIILDYGDYWEFGALTALFPDQPALAVCTDGDGGPNWGGFTQTLWNYSTASTTSYVGGGSSNSPPPSSTPPSSPTAPLSSTPPPSSTITQYSTPSQSAKDPSNQSSGPATSSDLSANESSNLAPNPSSGSSATGGAGSSSGSSSQETSSLGGEDTGVQKSTATGGTTPSAPSQVVVAGASTSYNPPSMPSLLLLYLWVSYMAFDPLDGYFL